MDRLQFVNNVLDLAPYGRQEDWEETPRPAGRSTPPTADTAQRPVVGRTTTGRCVFGQLRVSAVSSTTKEVCRELSSTPLNEMVAVVPASDETSKDFRT